MYDAQDRLLSYGALTYKYTANGERASQTDSTNGQKTSYTYDFNGNLASAILPSGTEIAYVIDGQGRRVGKKSAGTIEQGYLYQNGTNRLLAVTDASGNVAERFVYGSRLNIPDYMVRGGQTYRIISDTTGSPRLVINTSDGSIAEQITYDEFGNILQDSSPGFQPFGFAGCLYDQDTKLCHFGARDYDPVTGRWLQKDPIGFAGGDTNQYGYVLGDPINFVDSSGRGLVGALLGAAGAVVGDLATNGSVDLTDVALGAFFGAIDPTESYGAEVFYGAVTGYIASSLNPDRTSQEADQVPQPIPPAVQAAIDAANQSPDDTTVDPNANRPQFRSCPYGAQ